MLNMPKNIIQDHNLVPLFLLFHPIPVYPEVQQIYTTRPFRMLLHRQEQVQTRLDPDHNRLPQELDPFKSVDS